MGQAVEGYTMNLTSDIRTIEAGVQLKKNCQIIAALKKFETDLKNFAPSAAKIPKLRKLTLKTARWAKNERKEFAEGRGCFSKIDRYFEKFGRELKTVAPQ